MAITELQLPVIFVLTDEAGTEHTGTYKQADKQIHIYAHKVSMSRWGFSHKSAP